MSAFPEEIVQAARKIAVSLNGFATSEDFQRIATALMARDERAAGIARRQAFRLRGNEMYPAYGLNAQVAALEGIASAILTYDRPEKDNG